MLPFRVLRPIANINHIVDVVSEFPERTSGMHNNCTERRCLRSYVNMTQVQQMQKCQSQNCATLRFPMRKLNKAYQNAGPRSWKQTAWSAVKPGELCRPKDDYIAISHVWCDGTGIGLNGAGVVHTCLFEFFANCSKALGCKGVWWDAISLPTKRLQKAKAMDVMAANYQRAKFTVIHDQELVEFDWKKDGSAAVALTVSTWFTRGWTAAELHASRQHAVKVLLRTPGEGGCILVDLRDEIMVWNPPDNFLHTNHQKYIASTGKTPDRIYPRMGHVIASDLLEVLQQDIRNLEDLLAVMDWRTTSWPRDRYLIAGLLSLSYPLQ